MDKHTKEYYGRLAEDTIVVIGVGAIGSWVAYTLLKQGYDVIPVDFDIVENDNVPNTIFTEQDVGYRKTGSLEQMLYPTNVDTTFSEEIQNCIEFLPTAGTVFIDCVDNLETRKFIQRHCKEFNIELLHAGVFNGEGSVIWDQQYFPPEKEPHALKDCEIPYSVGLCVAIAGLTLSVLMDYLATGHQNSVSLDVKNYTLDRH